MSAPVRDSAPVATPNEATTTRPERSSRRVAHRAPLAWLPLALLAALALLLLVTFLVINAVDDDGPDGPAGDSLGQLGSSDGSGINGADGQAPGSGEGANGGTQGGAPQVGAPQAGTPQGGAPQGGSTGDAAALTSLSLVGGAGVAPAAASGNAATLGKRDAGTIGTVLFAEGSAEIDANGTKVVAQAVETLRRTAAPQVVVAGYTDVVAGQAVNDPLSERRAAAVAAALTKALPDLKVTTDARGQSAPVAPNSTDEGRQQNRRAAIVTS